MVGNDLFEGTWKCNLRASRLPANPTSWIQRIVADGEWIAVQEEILRPNAGTSLVRVHARLDGSDFPVTGSAIVDTMAYTREGNRIKGVGKRANTVSLREEIESDGQQMTIELSIVVGGKEVSAVAVFDRVPANPTG